MAEDIKQTHNCVLQILCVIRLLLFELLDLLQRKERPAAPPDGLLGVCHGPLVKRLRVAALYVQAQVLPVLGREVAHFAGERLLP